MLPLDLFHPAAHGGKEIAVCNQNFTVRGELGRGLGGVTRVCNDPGAVVLLCGLF
ncbi:hypothetical protein ACFMBG_08600 [Leisingera sp. D0M16]|uniref:hypothetical protein n=1 Tax=Leisingera coralii TaxID=3351347 RepID=UPI003B7BAEE6